MTVTVFVNVTTSVKVGDGSTELDNDVDGVGLGMRLAVPLGVAVSELVRAFSFVRLLTNVTVSVRVDDGVGRGFTDVVINAVVVTVLVTLMVFDTDSDSTAVVETLTESERLAVVLSERELVVDELGTRGTVPVAPCNVTDSERVRGAVTASDSEDVTVRVWALDGRG